MFYQLHNNVACNAMEDEHTTDQENNAQ